MFDEDMPAQVPRMSIIQNQYVPQKVQKVVFAN